MTESLPALIDRAASRLINAKSSAELLEAKQLAEAALHYARVTKAANDTHADCLRMITRAEIRMANEIDRGQKDDEIASRGRPPKNPHTAGVLPKYHELGISDQRVSEWRTVRDAGEEVVERVLRAAIDENRAPTKSEILAAAREIKNEAAEAKKEKRAERESTLAREILELPGKRYGVILADPEWRFEPYSRDTGMDRAADNHYPTTATDTICQRDVGSISADDCVLFLWATVPMLPDALRVMSAWGFEYKSHAIWAKDKIGTGYWFRNQHELLLVGTRGRIPAPAMGTQWPSLIEAPVGRHSEKPENVYELIETYFPSLPKIELNARNARDSWDCWGYEAPIASSENEAA